MAGLWGDGNMLFLEASNYGLNGKGANLRLH